MEQNKELYHHGVPGMKWGVRRYQNKDGSLTKAGERRYERDQRENKGKKKSERYAEPDSNRWVREDLDRSRRLIGSTKELTDNLKNLNNSTTSSRRKRMNLNEMTDKEMRDKINRELLERQYNDVFNPKKVSKGKEYLNRTLSIAGNTLAVTSSALGIALAIKELKG